ISATNACISSSLRTRRYSQRKKSANCTVVAAITARLEGSRIFSSIRIGSNGAALPFPKSSKLSKQRSRAQTQPAQKCPDARPIRRLLLHVEQFRRHAHRASQQIRVDVVGLPQRVQTRHALPDLFVRKLNLILSRLLRQVLRLLLPQLGVQRAV